MWLVWRGLFLKIIVSSSIDVNSVLPFPLLQLWPADRFCSGSVIEDCWNSLLASDSVPNGVIEGQGAGVGTEVGLSEKDKGWAPTEARHWFSSAIRSSP